MRRDPLADASGTITDRYSYDAFGNLQGHQGATGNPYLYTGQQYDATTGLYDLRARYYDPSTGRFLSQDVAGFNQVSPTNLNRYLYGASSPVNGMDPSGHDFAEFALRLQITVSNYIVERAWLQWALFGLGLVNTGV